MDVTDNRTHSATIRRRRYIIAVVIALGLGLMAWAALRETRSEKEILRMRSELRARRQLLSWEEMAALHRDPPEAQDAEIIYARAFAIATNNPPPPNTPFVMGGSSTLTEPIHEATRQQMTAYCKSTAEITNFLPASVPKGTRFPVHWSRGPTNVGGSYPVRARNALQLLATHVIEAAEAGDPERATEMFVHATQLSRCIPFDEQFIDHMFRHAGENLLMGSIERALHRTHFTDDQLQRMGAALEAEPADALGECVRMEHGFAAWWLEAVRNGMPANEVLGRRAEPFWERAWKRLKGGRRTYDDGDYLRYLAAIPKRMDALQLPAVESIAQTKAIAIGYDAKVASEVGEGISMSFLPRAFTRHWEAQARAEAFQTALAIERYRLANEGKLPDSIDALVPKYLSTIPADPFGKQPLRMKKLSSGYVVYSAGPDGVDNGGIGKTNNNAQPFYDVPFTVER